MTGKELYRLLIQNGWKEVSSKGSHRKLRKENQTIILPIHTKELAKGTEKSIKKQANLKEKKQ